MSGPTIDDIPQASALHTQLNTLNQAIALLKEPGSVVSTVLVSNEGAEVNVNPVPPIADPATLSSLVTALQAQAEDIARQLGEMGFGAG